MSDTAKTLVGRECKFAIHIPSRHRDVPDIHLVKEQLHYSDGTIQPNVRYIKDFKRPFWVTRPNKRFHEQKKEWEHQDNLIRKDVTQSELRNEVAKMLDKGWSKDHLKKLATSPYLYGCDITSTSLIKKMYQDKFPQCGSPYSVATFDIETDVLYGTNEAILATIIFKDQIFISAKKSFIQGISSLEDLFQKAIKKYIGEYTEKRKMKVTLHIAEDVIDMLRSVFQKAHEWKPDFLAIWNMDFDIPQILRMMKEHDVDPKDILCDPSVPHALRICEYKQGPKKKITASGKVIPINPAAQWHTLLLTASFYVIDAMCTYRHLRLSKQEKQSYSLDAILGDELGIRKLKFEQADEYSGLRWHQFMQLEYKIEYMVYNVFDCLSMIELDEKTQDLCYTLPSFAATTDFALFKSQPRRIADALHFVLLEEGYVLGTAGQIDEGKENSEEVEEDDTGEINGEEEAPGEVLGLDGWIVTLPAHMSMLGMACIEEDPTMRTGIRGFVYDSDAVSAYPSCISVGNVSKNTTKRELIEILGIDEQVFRMQNLNLVLGSTNSLEYCVTKFQFPQPDDLLTMFLNEA